MIGKVLRIRYEVTQSLDDGPLFASYLARDRIQGTQVCVRVFKQPFADEAEFVAAVGEAATRLLSIRHPCIERIRELEDDEGTPFLVGETSPGHPLSERIQKLAPFSVPVAVSTALSIADGLGALHDAGIVHGDLGAHNVVMTPSGEARLQLAGIWEAYGRSAKAGLAVLPTMAPYMAPEVSQGAHPSPSSDVYGLGVILFQLLTGRLPFIADQPVAMAIKHATEAVPSVRALNASVPISLEDVVKKALAKDPNQRYGSAQAIASDLRIIQDALRFGKSANVSAKRVEEPVAVAPRMSALEPERRRKPQSEAPEVADGDVPMWLRMALVFFLSLVVFMVGGWIIFNLSKPRLVTVPDVRRLTISEAEEQLKAQGLRLRVARREASDQVRPEAVLDTDPSPGSKVYEGSTVSAVLSLGSRTVEVPDVRGVTPDRARVMLESLGLRLDERILEKRSRSLEPGLIMEQVPERGLRVDRGTSVRVTVAVQGRPERRGDPELDAKYLYMIRIRLSDIDAPVILRVDMTDSRVTKTVHEERHLPGDDVEIAAEGFGPEAVFRIFYDGELVKQITKKASEEGIRSP